MSLYFKCSETGYGFIFVVRAAIKLIVLCVCFFFADFCDDKNCSNLSVTFFYKLYFLHRLSLLHSCSYAVK